MNTLRVDVIGAQAEEAGATLCQRLQELHVDARVEGGQVLLRSEQPGDASDGMRVELSPHDSLAFAGEKILDDLDEAGWIALDGEDDLQKDAAAMSLRLRQLGYME